MFIEQLARVWGVKNTLPQQVDLIAFATFGATRNGLSRGSEVVLQAAVDVSKMYPNAKVVFASFKFNPQKGFEEDIKMPYFPAPIFAGNAVNTVDEVERIKAALPKDFVPRSIIFITDEWHSRSARLSWKKAWKRVREKPDIRIIAVPSSSIIGGDGPITALRSHPKWALMNVIRQAFLVFIPFGYWVMKKIKIHQPTKTA